MQRPLRWLIVALVGAVLLAGCGGGSSSTASSQSTPTPSATTSAPAATSPTPTTGAGGLSVQQAVATCRSVVKGATTLPANLKAKVEGICNKAANGDLAGARAAAKEVCVEVINSYPVPAGPAKEQALAACNKAK